MQKSQLKLLTPVTLALILALGVSACGKNMNLNLKTGPQAGADNGSNGGNGGGNPNSKVGIGLDDGSGAQKDGNTDGNKGGNQKEDRSKKTAALTDGYLDLDGKLRPFSVFDLTDPNLNGSSYPYLNKEKVKDAAGNESEKLGDLKHLGDALGFVKRNNLVFRAIKHVPKKEMVKSVDNFSLELKGVRLYNEKGVTRNTLAKQVLCIVDTKSCSGQKADETNEEKANLNQLFWNTDTIKSKDFAEKSVPVEFKKIEEAVLMSTEAEAATGSEIKSVTLDLISAYGLKGKSAEEIIAWIEANTTAFTIEDKPELGYRKFRFVVANNVYIREGQLILQYTLKDEAKDKDVYGLPTVADYKNGPTDAADGSQVIAVPADTEQPKVEPKKEDQPKVEEKKEELKNDNEQGKTVETPAANTDKIIIPAPIVNVVTEKPVLKEDKVKKVDIRLDLFDNILFFKVGKADINPSDLPKLGATAQLIKKAGADIRMTFLTGHTSITYPKKMTKAQGLQFNKNLGLRRATAVSKVLNQAQLPKGMLQVRGKVPTASSCPTAECAKDRKVIIEISLNDELKAKAGDSEDVLAQKEEELKRVRDQLAADLRAVWESNTEVQQ